MWPNDIYLNITLRMSVQATYNPELCAVPLILCCSYVTLVLVLLAQVPQFAQYVWLEEQQSVFIC